MAKHCDFSYHLNIPKHINILQPVVWTTFSPLLWQMSCFIQNERYLYPGWHSKRLNIIIFWGCRSISYYYFKQDNYVSTLAFINLPDLSHIEIMSHMNYRCDIYMDMIFYMVRKQICSNLYNLINGICFWWHRYTSLTCGKEFY